MTKCANATRVMENSIKHSFALLIVFAIVLVVHAQNDQSVSGFISIDCGLPQSLGSYSESRTGINYISDEPFINTGVSKTLLPEYQTGHPKPLARLRAFPEGIRNCYTVNITRGTSYLIRAAFYYGNYDNKSNPPRFDIHLGANFWDTIFFLFDYPLWKEIIHVPFDDYVHVCLVNNGTGTPFISSLELRPLVTNTYVTQSGSLALFKRVDLGSITNQSYRYPYDVLDRVWYHSDINIYKPNWTTISTSLTVNREKNYNLPLNREKNYNLPSEIMTTAITPSNANEPLTYMWYTNGSKAYYVYLHFAEIEKLKANQSRSFDIMLNGKPFYGPLVPDYLNATTIYSPSPLTVVTETFSFGSYTFSLVKRKNSTLPPILNAIEIDTMLDLSQPETNQDDVEAITLIKSSYGALKARNWDGDPCAPIKYLWEGLNCSYDGSDPPRITSLNLSSSGLTGGITSCISKLTMLHSLDLSNNSLTGPVPKFLSYLPNLQVLNLERNNFTGPIPAELITKSKNGSLSLSIDAPNEGENVNECNTSPCQEKKKNNILIPIVASVGGLVLLLFAAATILIGIKRKKKQVPPVVATRTKGSGNQNEFFEAKKRQFTYSEVLNITNNFVRVLGKGGFGTVYHGCIGDNEVAVKKLSPSSVQGYQQFQAEVKLLMMVHHRNLTSLVGYCIEGDKMALIYEYMTNGDLHSHLLDEGNANVLSWERRLQIALDAAQGLEYLHNGCKPPIIHRDVKTTNILLNENFQAKLADFGLSRTFPTDGGSHVSTIVVGTPGYLDPEYSTTNRLTEKSDVYSFGVVLLQIITSRSAILSRGYERAHISQWVRIMLYKGDIESIVDKKLQGNFDTNSVWKAVEIAMACVSQKSTKRPNMSQVLTELNECLTAELARRNHSRMIDPTNSTEVFSTHMTSEFGPLAR